MIKQQKGQTLHSFIFWSLGLVNGLTIVMSDSKLAQALFKMNTYKKACHNLDLNGIGNSMAKSVPGAVNFFLTGLSE